MQISPRQNNSSIHHGSLSWEGSQSSRNISSSPIRITPSLHVDLSIASESNLFVASIKYLQWHSFPNTQTICPLEAKGISSSLSMQSTISTCTHPLNEPTTHYPLPTSPYFTFFPPAIYYFVPFSKISNSPNIPCSHLTTNSPFLP